MAVLSKSWARLMMKIAADSLRFIVMPGVEYIL